MLNIFFTKSMHDTFNTHMNNQHTFNTWTIGTTSGHPRTWRKAYTIDILCVCRLAQHFFMVSVSIIHVHGWQIKCIVMHLVKTWSNRVLLTLLGKRSPFVVSLSIVNTRIVNKQSLLLNSTQLFYVMTHKLSNELVVFEFKSNLVIDKDQPILKHNGHLNDKMSINISKTFTTLQLYTIQSFCQLNPQV